MARKTPASSLHDWSNRKEPLYSALYNHSNEWFFCVLFPRGFKSEFASKFITMENTNFEAQERKAGAKAASQLRAALRTEISSVFNRRSGALSKSTVGARYKDGALDRLVVTTPHYSFKEHFGSSLTGTTPTHARGGANVRSFQRYMGGGLKVRQVAAHQRSGGAVASHVKGRSYESRNHIANALNATNALQELATALGTNRIVDITSQITF